MKAAASNPDRPDADRTGGRSCPPAPGGRRWPSVLAVRQAVIAVVAAGLIVAGVITVAYRPGRELLGPSAPAASRTPAARTVQGPFGPQAVDYVPAPAAPADEACVLPTASNPFGNFLLTDHADRPDRAPACEYDFVKDDIRREFNDGLPRNVGDVYERQNSQRQFYTMPNTRSLPDTKAFAEFLYGNSGGCKQDPSKCTGYN